MLEGSQPSSRRPPGLCAVPQMALRSPALPSGEPPVRTKRFRRKSQRGDAPLPEQVEAVSMPCHEEGPAEDPPALCAKLAGKKELAEDLDDRLLGGAHHGIDRDVEFLVDIGDLAGLAEAVH